MAIDSRQAKWDLRGVKLARHISEWSKDPSTKVGAVIMDQHFRPVSWGFNGLPAGIVDGGHRLENRDIKLALTLHAEHNAILFTKADLEQCSLYVWPFAPCSHCAAIIVQKKLARVVVGQPAHSVEPERWKWSFDLGREIFKEAGIAFLTVYL